MTTIIEQKARDFLFKEFSNQDYKFVDSGPKDDCELFVIDRATGKTYKGELKSSESTFGRDSHIRARLVFNKKAQKDMFEEGELIIVRVFLGNNPTKVILITREFLNNGRATLEAEERYTIKGRTNYDACTHLS